MPKFVFRSTQNIGAPAAEQDKVFLQECFIETGLMDILRDCNDARHILLGRTGAGKSALLARLYKEEEHVVQLKPDDLSLAYISNSNIIRYFAEAGVDLSLFYRLLWRHVFCVELLREKYGDVETKKLTFFDKLVPRNRKHELAISYLKKWGNKLWQETEYGVQELTSTVEKDLQSSLDGNIPETFSASFSAGKKLTEQEKKEIKHRGQDVVDRIQIRDLSAVMNFISDDFVKDRQQKFYIVIDHLDEDWVEDNLRLQLIRSLIETTSDFIEVENVKIIVALRVDLLDRVYRSTRASGFQEEKLRGNSLPVQWTEGNLVDVLDERINFLIREHYTKGKVTHMDILPPKMGKQPCINYILERTLFRPRDIIEFFNTCIRHADGQTVITPSIIKEAEGTYSRDRLAALADEWYGTYPNVHHLSQILKNKPEQFLVRQIDLQELVLNAIQLVASGEGKMGLDLEYMEKVGNNIIDVEDYRKNVILILYTIGLIGLKTETFNRVSWSYRGNESIISKAEIADDTKVFVHKTFHRVLGIHNRLNGFAE